MPDPEPLPPSALCRTCEPGRLAFETTSELADLEDTVGQTRAMEARGQLRAPTRRATSAASTSGLIASRSPSAR